jgi:hypothetical protein
LSIEENQRTTLNFLTANYSSPQTGNKLKNLVHETLPDTCTEGWEDIEYCSHNQNGENACKRCNKE